MVRTRATRLRACLFSFAERDRDLSSELTQTRFSRHFPPNARQRRRYPQ